MSEMEPRESQNAIHAHDPVGSSGNYSNRATQKINPVFETFYDDWKAFDAAVAHALTQHHPLRKRSSLTFEVYNRTVSKGRHDRKVIAEFLSKTYKCTHGIKFRARGHGKRLRHKLRDIGCPFHVYASAVEFGETYRVKVRVHDQHNHPIGPNAMTSVAALYSDSEYEFVAAVAEAPLILDSAPSVGPASQANTVTLSSQQLTQHAQARAHNLLRAQALVRAHMHAQSRRSTIPEQFVNSSASRCSETLLEQSNAMTGPSSLLSTSRPLSSRKRKSAFQFEDHAMTFEGLRRQLSAFAQERGWDQFHTPRNLLLGLTRESRELCECFQWEEESTPTQEWTSEKKKHLGEELSEMAIYLIHLADKCKVDLPAAITAKLNTTASKYSGKQEKKAAAASKSCSNERKRPRLENTTGNDEG